MFDKVLNTPLIQKNIHYVKSVQIRSFSSPYFPLFWLNTGKYGPEKSPYFNWILESTDQKNLRIWTLFTQCIDLIKSLVLVHLQAMKQYWQQILWRFWDVVADYNLWHSSISTFVVSGIAYRHLILQFSVLFIMSLNYVNWKLKMAKQIYQMNEQNQVLGVNFLGFPDCKDRSYRTKPWYNEISIKRTPLVQKNASFKDIFLR